MAYLEVLFISLRAALVALAIVVPVAAVAGWYIARGRGRLRHLVDVLATLPLALPPVVVGFVLLWLVGARGPFGGALSGLAFTWLMMSVASAIVALPLVVRSFAAALSTVDARLEMTARNLGASRVRVLLTITLPLARRGFAAGLLLGFVRAFAEFGATIVVAGNIPGQTQGIPSAVWTEISTGDYGTAWVLSAVSLAIGVIALIAHNVIADRSGAARRSGTSEAIAPDGLRGSKG